MAPPAIVSRDAAVKTRERLYQRVQLAYDLINKPDKVGDFQIRVNKLEDTFTQYEEVNDQINLFNAQILHNDATESEVDTVQNAKSFEELFYKVKAHEAKLASVKAEQNNAGLDETFIHRENVPKVKLPTIHIPMFDGDISSFPSWCSLYKELVHTSDQLTDIQKFSYLKSYLRGSALACVETIAFTAANYPLAFKSLTDRYGKKRILACTLMNKLLDFKPLTNDSISGLQNFLDGFYVVVESIKSLTIANLDEFMLVHLGMKVLDNATRVEFEKEMVNKEFPTFQDLVLFVRNKAQILVQTAESNSSTHVKSMSNQHRYQQNPHKSKVLMVNKKSEKVCHICSQGPHKISMCPKFQQMDTKKRFTVVKEMKLCFSCLSATHGSSTCPSIYRCRTCGSSRHHSLLHQPNNQQDYSCTNNNQASTSTLSESKVVSGVAKMSTTDQVASANAATGNSILLGTATLKIQNNLGNWITARCVVDPGSQVSIISETLAQTLNLPRKFCNLLISGIGSSADQRTKGELHCKILPEVNNQHINCNQTPLQVNVVIMSKIVAQLPSSIPPSVLQKFSNLKLADSSYYKNTNSTNVDMLLGAEYYQDIILHDQPIISGRPCAIPSIFGYLLLGRVCAVSNEPTTKCTSLFISSIQEDQVSMQLQKFWALEEVGAIAPVINENDKKCEDHFLQTHTRNVEGRYIVKLPFIKESPPLLGSNRNKATRFFHAVERKLEKNLQMKELYVENLNTYLDSDHMEVAKNNVDYLLGHHGVYREDSSTSKLRVVFSPNLESNKGQTLSNILCVGPKLQLDIQDLLLGFRLHPIVFTCDIQAMYRNILVAPEDRQYQHILWRPDSSQPLLEYELKTVTFGLPPSPFLALRVIKQLALDEQHNFPRASKILLESTYVDDLLGGENDISLAIQLRDELIALLKAGGFTLRKWASSHPEILQDLSNNLSETPHLLGASTSIKVLGVQWLSQCDCFTYSVSVKPQTVTTKRHVLSVLATIYDVNGFLSPVVVYMKIFMQKLWLNKDDTWDSPVPLPLQHQWERFLEEIPLLCNLRIPRYILSQTNPSYQLIGFCDACQTSYAACVYLRVADSNGVNVHLVRAKTKVAPLKVLTINKLELCSAYLLSKVFHSLTFLIEKLKISEIYLFSDSKTVLSWLQIQPHLLKTFVANRVVQILDWTDPSFWHHVSSEDNAADPASRGLTPAQLLESSLWFDGPAFLQLHKNQWPIYSSSKELPEKVPELKQSEALTLVVKASVQSDLVSVISKFSSLSKLINVFGWVLRFLHNVKHPNKCFNQTLSVEEEKVALKKCIWISQSNHFSKEIQDVQNGHLTSSLRPLSPIMLDGFLAVGGRLSNASIPDHAKHPILLSKKCHLTVLLIRHYHLITIHGGPKLIQSLMQQRYWIINARNIIRSIIAKCIACTKSKALTLQPLMADLPTSRVTQGRPFLNVGVDFAGPFLYKTGPRRNSPVDKCYLAVFICMATKCVHLEIVSSLSTPAFIATLDRFVSRRGLPSVIHSDNGTNFRGAASYLTEVQHFLKDADQTIASHLRSQEVTWSFIPPSSPNFGGLWEAAVKSAKYHLKYVLKEHALNFEEFSTLSARIEAILNSRPLCAISTNPNDGIDYLSPGHFLIGAPLIARPDSEECHLNLSIHRRWNLILQVVNSFWKRWSQDYLNTQIQRSKWTKPSHQLQLGDIVMIQAPNVLPQSWPLGRIISVLPGKDGVVRVVGVKTQHGEIIRPVSKLVPLPVCS